MLPKRLRDITMCFIRLYVGVRLMKTIFDNIKPILALIVLLLGFSYFYMCSIRNIKPDPQILIAIVSAVSQALSYYFGSSTKSNAPDQTTVQNAENVTVKK